jgi:hypothetical protein
MASERSSNQTPVTRKESCPCPLQPQLSEIDLLQQFGVVLHCIIAGEQLLWQDSGSRSGGGIFCRSPAHQVVYKALHSYSLHVTLAWTW